MAKIKIVLPEGQTVATGMQVSFIAQCSCSDTTCLQINGVDYTLVDALGNNIGGKSAWATGALISALLDVSNKKAYVLNAGTLLIAGGTITGNLGVTGTASFGGYMMLTEGVHYGASLPPNSEATKGRLFFKELSQ